MNHKRFQDIIWERDNAPEKFKEHAHEYFEEAIPLLQKATAERPPIVETESVSKHEYKPFVFAKRKSPKKK